MKTKEKALSAEEFKAIIDKLAQDFGLKQNFKLPQHPNYNRPTTQKLRASITWITDMFKDNFVMTGQVFINPHSLDHTSTCQVGAFIRCWVSYKECQTPVAVVEIYGGRVEIDWLCNRNTRRTAKSHARRPEKQLLSNMKKWVDTWDNSSGSNRRAAQNVRTDCHNGIAAIAAEAFLTRACELARVKREAVDLRLDMLHSNDRRLCYDIYTSSTGTYCDDSIMVYTPTEDGDYSIGDYGTLLKCASKIHNAARLDRAFDTLTEDCKKLD